MRTNSSRAPLAVVLASLSLVACGQKPVAVEDDAGTVVVSDAGLDASVIADAGETLDSGSASDAGEPADGSVVFDAGTVDAGATDAGGVCTSCTVWNAPSQVGMIGESLLFELSGLAASQVNPGVLYAHNDSGDRARFFALSSAGAALGQFVLDGGSASDWEDVAVGPCGTGSCVYLGDIGDNSMVRTNYAVYRVPEPSLPGGAAVGTHDVPWERFPFQYPGGAKHNAESLVMNPLTGDLYLFTKETAGVASHAYRFPPLLVPNQMLTLTMVATLPVPISSDMQLTGASVAPCGNSVLLRMYNRAVQLTATPGQTFEDLLTNPPTQVAVAAEQQGEAIAFSADGRSFFTSTERVNAALPQALSRSTCH